MENNYTKRICECLIVGGIIGISFSLVSASFIFTGNYIFEANSKTLITSAVIFFVSLILVFIGLWKIRRR